LPLARMSSSAQVNFRAMTKYKLLTILRRKAQWDVASPM